MKSVIPKQTDYELLNGEGHWLPSFFSTLGTPEGRPGHSYPFKVV